MIVRVGVTRLLTMACFNHHLRIITKILLLLLQQQLCQYYYLRIQRWFGTIIVIGGWTFCRHEVKYWWICFVWVTPPDGMYHSGCPWSEHSSPLEELNFVDGITPLTIRVTSSSTESSHDDKTLFLGRPAVDVRL
jgi:hypothetical protein